MRKIKHGGYIYSQRIAQLAYIYLNMVDCNICGSPKSCGYICPFCDKDDTDITNE